MKNKKMDLNRISRKVSFLLRHSQEFIDGHGWAKTADIVREIKKSYPEFSRELLEEIVRTDEKGRYSFDKFGIRIRANQGHSAPVDLELEKVTPPEILYHGTADRFLPSIMREGLTGQSRLHVHLSATTETAVKVGARHGRPVVLQVRAGDMRADGYDFFLSENHVWLTHHVPPQYLERMHPDE